VTWNDAYLENRVLSADPLELIRMLYQAALDSVASARRHLAAGDIPARSRSIGRALAIVGELEGALDHSAGGPIARTLADLYRYIRQRLTEANLRQKDAPLAESESLLETLFEGWRQVQPAPAAPVLAGSAWNTGSPQESHTWNA